MKKFLMWLFNVDDVQRKRTVNLWVDNGSGAIQVGVVEVSYEQMEHLVKTFDTLDQLVFKVADEEGD